jgi:hypothetical protein
MDVVQVSPRVSTTSTAASPNPDPDPAKAYRPCASWWKVRPHAGVREGFPQLLHARAEPPVDDGEARGAGQGAGAGHRAEQIPGASGDAAEVPAAVEVVGHYFHVGGADPGVVQ